MSPATIVSAPKQHNSREAFLLKRIEQLSHAEIARRLGVSVRTIFRYMVKELGHLRPRRRKPFYSAARRLSGGAASILRARRNRHRSP
ncbi:MAG: sigma factor-like helix-turn-helix DNA-binding protein [Methylocella sp.]